MTEELRHRVSTRIAGVGRRSRFPPLHSATLGPDDALLARSWLSRPERWDSAEEVHAYEEEFARWNGSAHAVAFSTGRSALSACLEALELRPGDEVVVPAYTCVVVANAVRFAGLVPRYADIELDTYGLDARKLHEGIGKRTRVVVLQHLFGLVARDYEETLEQCRQKGLVVIEDCAQSTGATWYGRRVGGRGTLAIYSSEHSKIYSTVQGGMATTEDAELARRLRLLAESSPSAAQPRVKRLLETLLLDYYSCSHARRFWLSMLARLLWGRSEVQPTTSEEIAGRRPSYYGHRLPAPLAEIGRNQLRKAEGLNARRRRGSRRWAAWCEQTGVRPPLVCPGSQPVFLRYPVLVEPERKADLGWAERELGVRPGVWFTSQLHPAPGVINGCPNSLAAVRGCINFPTLLAETEGAPGGKVV